MNISSSHLGNFGFRENRWHFAFAYVSSLIFNTYSSMRLFISKDTRYFRILLKSSEIFNANMRFYISQLSCLPFSIIVIRMLYYEHLHKKIVSQNFLYYFILIKLFIMFFLVVCFEFHNYFCKRNFFITNSEINGDR